MNRRRALRAVILGGALLLLLALLAHAGLVRWADRRWAAAAARYESEVGSLDLASEELPPVAVEENAATWISKGAAAVVLETDRPGDGGVTAIAARPPASWGAEDVATVRAAAALNRDALEIIARARLAEASTFGIRTRDGAAAKLPNLLEIMNATKLLYARATLALREGRRDDALADLELLGAIARNVERERVMIVILIGSAVERLELRLVHAFAEDPATTRAEIGRLAESLLESDLLANYVRSSAWDGSATCMALRNGEAVLGSEAEPYLLRALRPAIDPALAAACLDLYREVGAALGRPRPEVRAKLAEVQHRKQSLWFLREVGEIVIPNLVNGASRMGTNLALRRLAAIALAARTRAIDSGAYPASLDAFALARTPDPLTGGAPRWQIASDGAAVLDLPGAEEITVEIFPPGGASSVPWIWRLPAPRSR